MHDRVQVTTRLIGPTPGGIALTFLALWAFSGDAPRSLAVSVLAMSHVALGKLILDRVFTLESYGRYDRMFLDWAVGSSVAIAFIFVAGEFIGWPTAIIVVTVVALVALVVSLVAARHTSISGSPDVRWGTAFLVVVLMYLARDYRWAIGALPGGLLLLAAALLLRRRLLAGALCAVGIAIIGFAYTRRGPLWWYITDDNQLFSSITTAIARFGATDPLGPLGPLGIRYHVGTYVYAAMLELPTAAAPYAILERFLPMLLAIAMAGTSLVIIRRFPSVNPISAVAVLFVVTRAFGYSAHSLSFVHGVVIVAALTLLLVESERPASTTTTLVVFCSLGLMAAVIKASNIPIVALLAFVILVAAPWREGVLAVHHVVRVCALVGSIGIYGSAFLLGDRSSRQLNTFAWFGFARERFPDIGSIDERMVRYAASAVAIAAAFGLPAIVLITSFRGLRAEGKLLATAGWVSVVLGLLLATVSGNAANGYFVSVTLMMTYLISMAILCDFVGLFPERSTYVVAIAGFAVGLLAHWLLQFVNGPSNLELFARILLPSPLPWMLLLGVIALSTRVLRRSQTTAAIRFTLVGALCIMIGAGTAAIQRLDAGGELDREAIDVAIGAPLERDVSGWINANTSDNAVLATNRFCANCIGREWFERDIALVGDDYNFVGTDTTLGGNDFRMTSLAERRFLIQGPRYLLVNGYPVDEAAARVRLSLEFANAASKSAHAALKRYGVTHFVVDTTLTGNRSWVPWAVEVYRNDRFVVLRLN